MKIDTENVIIEVRRRPCLWDKTHESYRNKDARYAAWEEVLKELAPNFQSLSAVEKRNEDKKIQQRWRTARDTYIKENSTKKKPPSGSDNQKKKKYTFYDMLTFLDKKAARDVDETMYEEQSEESSSQSDNADPQPSLTNQQPSSTINQVQEKSAAETQPSSSRPTRFNKQLTHSTRQKKPTKPKSKRGISIEKELLQYLKSRELEIEKDDLAFYKSIQPTLNSFNSYQKLIFRTKVLNLLTEMTHESVNN